MSRESLAHTSPPFSILKEQIGSTYTPKYSFFQANSGVQFSAALLLVGGGQLKVLFCFKNSFVPPVKTEPEVGMGDKHLPLSPGVLSPPASLNCTFAADC